MKKLSVLIALALCLTIGGAYATWTFATASITTNNAGLQIAIAGSETTDIGTIAIDKVPSFTVEPKYEVSGDKDAADRYNPVFVVATGSNDLVITFTPDDLAPAEVKEHGILSTIAISITTNKQYGTDNVISVTTSSLIIGADNSGETIKWVKSGDTFTATISAETVKNCFTLTSFSIDTLAKYNEYAPLISGVVIDIKVTTNVG